MVAESGVVEVRTSVKRQPGSARGKLTCQPRKCVFLVLTFSFIPTAANISSFTRVGTTRAPLTAKHQGQNHYTQDASRHQPHSLDVYVCENVLASYNYRNDSFSFTLSLFIAIVPLLAFVCVFCHVGDVCWEWKCRRGSYISGGRLDLPSFRAALQPFVK